MSAVPLLVVAIRATRASLARDAAAAEARTTGAAVTAEHGRADAVARRACRGRR
jgi:hypothetical protein